MLKDGARDGVVARAVHDYLYGYRNGRVSATLNILSVDFSAQTIIMSRNNPCPFYIITEAGLDIYDEPSSPICIYPIWKPVITQHPIVPRQYFIAFTDGIFGAGSRYGAENSLREFLNEIDVEATPSPAELAEKLLYWSMHLDRDRPGDDMSVIILGVFQIEDDRPKVRSLGLAFQSSGYQRHDGMSQIVVVGPCGSGKTTLVRGLQAHGYVARGRTGTLDRHRALATSRTTGSADPLNATPTTITARRGAEFPGWLYDEQMERLMEARSHADLVLATNDLTPGEVLRRVVDFLRRQR